MNYKNTVNTYSGLLICLIAFTAIAEAKEKEMNSWTFEDLFKFNQFVSRVPINITSDGRWIAYNRRCCMNHIAGMALACCFFVSFFFRSAPIGVCPAGSFD